MKNINCNLCKKNNTKVLFYGEDRLHQTTIQKFAIHKCSNCGLVYLNPQPSKDELSAFYPDNYGPFGKGDEIFKKSKIYNLFRSIKRFFSGVDVATVDKMTVDYSQKKFLDFGCGAGKFLEETKKKHPNFDLYGLDIDPRACQVSSEKGFKILCGEIHEANYPDNFFDVINLSQVVEHLQDPSSVLNEIYRILKPNGLIQIDTPNFSSIGSRLFKTYWHALDTPRHLYLFTPKTIKIMLTQIGFKNVYVTTNFSGGDTILPHSIDFLLHGKDTGVHPLLFHILKPVNKILKKIGMFDVMLVRAIKK